MTSRLRAQCTTAAVLFLASAMPALASGAPAAGTAKVPGDLWDVTSQMSMEGMPMAMPAQQVKVCSPKDWTKPPAPANEKQKCVTSDFAIDGATATWKVTCENPPMTGTGEITRDGAAAYTGAIKFTSDQGNLTIKLDGHRVGDCDAPQQ